MKFNERQNQIMELVEKRQRVSVHTLAKTLYVSEMTVRRDLAYMEREGALRRYHGGAMAIEKDMDYSIDLRMHINEKEKRDLAKRAERYLENGQTIFLPASSTCAFLLPSLKRYEDLCVITNSVQFMLLLSKMKIRCILSGGEYVEQNKMLIGRGAEYFLRSVNSNIAFLACDGISEDGTVSVEDEHTAEIVRIGFQNSEKRIILADHTKLGRKYTYNICRTEEADDILVI
ncbi:MAG: DeoR/GlpR transcriptional regulator [Clostridia bacterium]|nr:DeoR/GlpR transcriptional regulator [Clostridia bacterium]